MTLIIQTGIPVADLINPIIQTVALKNISLSPRRIGYYYPFKRECNDHDSAYFTYSEVFISNIFLKFILRGIVGQRLKLKSMS
jgi:hypothetical protein